MFIRMSCARNAYDTPLVHDAQKKGMEGGMRNGILFFLLLLFSICMYVFGAQDPLREAQRTAALSAGQSSVTSHFQHSSVSEE